jgi:hypothetical protein
MTQQTAVDWLVSQIEEYIRKSARNEFDTIRTGDFRIGLRKAIDFCEQAKQMEKEQIEDAYIMGSYDMASKEFKPEQYYNETYGED